MIVQTLLKRDHEIGGDVVPVKAFESVQPNAAKVGAAKLHQRLAFERIKLQIDFEIFLVLSKSCHKIFFLRDPHAVRVYHQMANRSCLCHLNDGEKVRMYGRLAA